MGDNEASPGVGRDNRTIPDWYVICKHYHAY